MYIIIFIFILAVLVFVHELGHFLAAKISGIRVDEFAIGFPPRIVGWKRGETDYSLNWIPFGGYVKIFGENYQDEDEMNAPEAASDKSRSFAAKSKKIQAFVLIAGILFNIIFAWLLFSLGFMIGMPVANDYTGPGKVSNSAITVTLVEKDSPAEKAGLKLGDQIVAISSATEIIQSPNIDQVKNFIVYHKDVPITISVASREAAPNGSVSSTPIQIPVTPHIEVGKTSATVGIGMEFLGRLKLSFFPALWQGALLTNSVVVATAVGIVQFLYTIVVGQAHVSDVTGPIGIAGLVGDATALGFIYLLSFTAFISINLAIINLIPFPALDGGRILFVIIEKIKGTPFNAKAVQIVNGVGLGLLLLLMVFVTYHDVVSLWK